MKKLLVLLLLSTAMFSQTTTVKGITLSYDKVSQTMTLSIPQNSMKVYSKDEQVRVIINKEASLKKYLGGLPILTSANYFTHEGYFYTNMSYFQTSRPNTSIVIKTNLIFKFTDVEKGEYVLEVSDVCDWKWESNVDSNSLIVK